MVIGQNIKNKFKITSGTSRTANDYTDVSSMFINVNNLTFRFIFLDVLFFNLDES